MEYIYNMVAESIDEWNPQTLWIADAVISVSVLSVDVEVVLGFAAEDASDLVQRTSTSGICPDEQDEQSYEHASQMGIVRHSVVAACHKQFYYSISYDKKFCLDRYWYREDEHAFVGNIMPKASRIPYTAPEAPTVFQWLMSTAMPFWMT